MPCLRAVRTILGQIDHLLQGGIGQFKFGFKLHWDRDKLQDAVVGFPLCLKPGFHMIVTVIVSICRQMIGVGTRRRCVIVGCRVTG